MCIRTVVSGLSIWQRNRNFPLELPAVCVILLPLLFHVVPFSIACWSFDGFFLFSPSFFLQSVFIKNLHYGNVANNTNELAENLQTNAMQRHSSIFFSNVLLIFCERFFHLSRRFASIVLLGFIFFVRVCRLPRHHLLQATHNAAH